MPCLRFGIQKITKKRNECGAVGRSPRSVSTSSTTARVGLSGVALPLHKIVNAKKLFQVFAIFLDAFSILQALQSLSQYTLKEYQSAHFILLHRLICYSLRNDNCFIEDKIL